jgi:hypothetical protein
MHGEEAGQYVIDELATSDSNIPTDEELELVTYLLRTSQDETGPSVRAVCEAPCRWNDWDLWLQPSPLAIRTDLSAWFTPETGPMPNIPLASTLCSPCESIAIISRMTADDIW